MRTSKRSEILDAAARVVQEEGVKAVTFESVAAAAGMTKGGLVYHFPTREAMITALHTHLAEQWEAGMTAALPRAVERTAAADEPSIGARLEAYARASMQSATRAELLFLLEGSTTPEHAAPWNDVLARWTPPTPTDLSDPVAVDRFIMRLAADGLWVYESLSSQPLDPELRQRIADLIASRIPRHQDD